MSAVQVSGQSALAVLVFAFLFGIGAGAGWLLLKGLVDLIARGRGGQP